MDVRHFRKVTVILAVLLFVLIFDMAFQSEETYAGSKNVKSTVYNEAEAFERLYTVKGTMYRQVMKYKNTAFVASCAGLYKVKLSKGKVKQKTRLVKVVETYGPYSLLYGMRKKGSYVYYIEGSNGIDSRFRRVGIYSHRIKTLANNTYAYAFKGKKIYYTVEGEYSTHHKVMTLNGKNKKETAKEVAATYKKSNVKGYKVINKKKGKYVISYLKTPKGKYKLGKVYNFSY